MSTKKDLEDALDEVGDLADAALDPELSREQVVAKVKEIANLVENGPEEADGVAED